MMDSLFRFVLRRPLFKGQDRLFNYLFTRGKFGKKTIIATPLEGNFKIQCNPSTWIGAKITYTGNYEPALKKVFRSVIKKGDHILDIGANIGFHTLYFAELVGPGGTVTAFEPVPQNFEALIANIALNDFKNIVVKNIALGIANETFTIKADKNSNNPGTYNLFDKQGDVSIECRIGDEVVLDKEKIDFIKIDVEGYESFVIEGLIKTIKKHKPIIIFEYDKSYHQKTGLSEDYIFSMLKELGYSFHCVFNTGLQGLNNFREIRSANILARPNA